MKKYNKIQTVFKRDPSNNNVLLERQFSLSEFEYLQHNQWLFTEKVDGTNIRVMLSPHDSKVRFGGKTDNAQLNTNLLYSLQDLFPLDKMKNQFTYDEPTDVCLYGEGYGKGIRRGGKYSDIPNFVLFDVKIGKWWLERNTVETVAKELGIDVVPIIGQGTLWDMVDIVKQGFHSQWGSFMAEGIVARPLVQLFNHKKERIITKLKYKDFPH